MFDLDYLQEGAIALLTLKHPPANAFTPDGSLALQETIAKLHTRRMILTRERVDARTALCIGLVDDGVDEGSSVEAAIKMVERVVNLSQQSVEHSKALIHQARIGVPRAAALAVERERLFDLFYRPNQREGVNAFRQKRSPNWQHVAARGASA